MSAKCSKGTGSSLAREKLLSIAGRLFWQKGYLRTSVEEIGNAAKMNKAMIYYYFKNKVALLYELMSRANQRLLDQASSIMNSNMPPDQKMKAFIINHVKFELDNLGVSGIGQLERRNLPPKLLLSYNSIRDEYEGIFRKIIKEGMEAGKFRCKDINLSSLFILGLLNSIVQWFKPVGRLSSDEIALEVYEFVARGLDSESKSDSPE